MPLNPTHGVEGIRRLAVIDEAWCIGCTLCIDACPVDAIVGAPKLMHTVIDAHCTGCELCIPVCPVDCIAMQPASGSRTGWAAWSAVQAQAARERYALHRTREQRRADERVRRLDANSPAADADTHPDATYNATAAADARRAAVTAALAKARGRHNPAG